MKSEKFLSPHSCSFPSFRHKARGFLYKPLTGGSFHFSFFILHFSLSLGLLAFFHKPHRIFKNDPSRALFLQSLSGPSGMLGGQDVPLRMRHQA
jgi:hypothetical protein